MIQLLEFYSFIIIIIIIIIIMMLWLVLLSTSSTGYLRIQRLRWSTLRMALVVDNTIVYINNCPTRCNKPVYLLFCKFTLHVSGVNHTHHQELQKKIWPVLEAVVTVLCSHDDGCGWHPKHVEWTCRIINRLLCVSSRWTIINIDQRCTEP